MESWLPWLTEGEHVLFDLVGQDAEVALVEPRRMRDRAAELLDEEAALASTLAQTWGATSRDDGWPRLHLPFDRLLAHTDAPVRTVAAAPEGPGTAVVAASGWDPVMGDGARLAKQLRELLADGFRVVIAADGTGSAARIAQLLAEEGLALPAGRERRPPAAGRERRRRAARAWVRAAGQQARGAVGERRHRSPARPSPTSAAARATDGAPTRVLRGPAAGRLRRPLPTRRRPLRRHGEAHHRRRGARLPAARVPRRRQALRAVRPDRRGASLHGWRDADAAPAGRLGVAAHQESRACRGARGGAGAGAAVPASGDHAGPRVRGRLTVAARVGAGVPVPGDARSAQGHRRREGRHGGARADGPPRVRRRRLRQDRGRHPRRVQGGAGRQAGGGARAHDAAGAAAPAARSASASRAIPCASRCCRASSRPARRRRSSTASPTARSTSSSAPTDC